MSAHPPRARRDRAREDRSSSPAPTTATSTACSRRPAAGLATAGHPGQPGRARRRPPPTTVDRALERRRGRRRRVRRARVRGDPRRALSRPTWAWSRRCEGFLELLRNQADANGALLVFDEVITRLPRRRAAARRSATGVTPRPHGHGQGHRRRPARRRLRRRARADGARSRPAGDVYQAGTLSGNPAGRRRRARDAARCSTSRPTCGSRRTTDALADGPARRRGGGRARAGRRACPAC